MIINNSLSVNNLREKNNLNVIIIILTNLKTGKLTFDTFLIRKRSVVTCNNECTQLVDCDRRPQANYLRLQHCFYY